MNNYPKSVSQKIIDLNPTLWQISSNLQVDLSKTNIISGSSFVDIDQPAGEMGNPFAVVVGKAVGDLSLEDKTKIAKFTNTPETVFVDEVDDKTIHLTVLTPSGAEMGACAHGFLGALQVLMQTNQLSKDAGITIKTTASTSAEVVIKNGLASLIFTGETAKQLEVGAEQLSKIYGMAIPDFINCGVLSVGSPKLVIEVTPDVFEPMQRNLRNLDYASLLKFQQDNGVNGIHVFCRDQETGTPKACIQNNAFSGPDNLADRATGVSNAAQIISDTKVQVGQSVLVTQYSFGGPSAMLEITKLQDNKALVGGAATLFNCLPFTNVGDL